MLPAADDAVAAGAAAFEAGGVAAGVRPQDVSASPATIAYAANRAGDRENREDRRNSSTVE